MSEVATLHEQVRNPGIKPAINNVLVEPENQEKLTAGGIALPDSVTESRTNQAFFGTLIARGPDAWDDFTVQAAPKVGRRVVYSRYAGYQLTGEDGTQYRMMRDVDIAGEVSENVVLGEKL